MLNLEGKEWVEFKIFYCKRSRSDDVVCWAASSEVDDELNNVCWMIESGVMCLMYAVCRSIDHIDKSWRYVSSVGVR